MSKNTQLESAVITGQFDPPVYIVAPVAQMGKQFTKLNHRVPVMHIHSVVGPRFSELLYGGLNVTAISKTI
jgi:hypothetical protein